MTVLLDQLVFVLAVAEEVWRQNRRKGRRLLLLPHVPNRNRADSDSYIINDRLPTIGPGLPQGSLLHQPVHTYMTLMIKMFDISSSMHGYFWFTPFWKQNTLIKMKQHHTKTKRTLEKLGVIRD